MNQPRETGRTQAGPDLENALRGCLISGVILVETDKKIATLTPEAFEILGWPKQPTPECALEKLPAAVLKPAMEASTSGRPAQSEQVALGTGDTSQLIHVSAVPIKAGAGTSTIVLTMHAFKSEPQFLKQIRHLDRLANTGTLAAGMAHEIKNALVAGRTFLDLLLERNTDEELVQIVRRETSRIDAIVSRMLRFASNYSATLKPLHLHEVLEHALRLVQPEVAAKSVVLERSMRARSDTIRADEYELHQAFVNLLLNALEAMGKGGTLSVSTEAKQADAKQDQLEIRIGDTGEGILPEHMDHVFEPFFTTKASGTGLGLAVTQRIIQEHGGSISVRSQPGRGTTFAVTLPLAVDEPAAQPGGAALAISGKKRE